MENSFVRFFVVRNPQCLPIRSSAVPGPHDIAGDVFNCQCLVRGRRGAGRECTCRGGARHAFDALLSLVERHALCRRRRF